jgi:hypothetical protein
VNTNEKERVERVETMKMCEERDRCNTFPLFSWVGFSLFQPNPVVALLGVWCPHFVALLPSHVSLSWSSLLSLTLIVFIFGHLIASSPPLPLLQFSADMYLQNMRGSNNRLDEARRDRNNANRYD